MTTIAFIGAGNMAASIIGGLIKNNTPATSIVASDPNQDTLDKLSSDYGIATTTDNQVACSGADVVVLAIKPQVLKPVTESLAPDINSKTLVISIAAGVSSGNLDQWLGGGRAVVRCMPNTPALIQEGAAGLYANKNVSSEQRQQAESLMSAVGLVTWLENESLIDAVTAISGSGPAYFFLMIESMIAAGIAQGLSAEQSQQLAIQTASGAAKLAQNSDVAVDELRRRVTSPGGTTEQAILSFENSGFRKVVKDAMDACKQRSEEMASEFS